MKQRRPGEKNRLALDFQIAFDTDSGKEVLKALSKKCREHVATYVAGDTHHTAYLEGMRSVILYIRAQLDKNINEERAKEAIQCPKM